MVLTEILPMFPLHYLVKIIVLTPTQRYSVYSISLGEWRIINVILVL